jgi:hypothetical protein
MSSSQSSVLALGSFLPRPCLVDQPKSIIELIYQYLKIMPDFYRFALSCRRVYLSSLSSISWSYSFVCLSLSRALEVSPLQSKLFNLRRLNIKFCNVNDRNRTTAVHGMLWVMGGLDLSLSCPLLESLALQLEIQVDQREFLQSWNPFFAGLSKCQHLRRLRLKKWTQPLTDLETLNPLEDLVIRFNKTDSVNQTRLNSAIKSLPNLKKVDLWPMTGETMDILATRPNLVDLDLIIGRQSRSAEVFPLSLPNLKSLKTLRCDQIEILKSPKLSEVTALECLYFRVYLNSDELDFSLVRIPTLKRLEIESRKSKFDWHWIVNFVQNNPQLESIDIQSSGTIEHLNPNHLLLLLKNQPNLMEFALEHRFLTHAPFKSVYLDHVTDRGRIRNRLNFMCALMMMNEPIQPIGRGVKRPFISTETEEEH